MRISDWSSDVCSSDLRGPKARKVHRGRKAIPDRRATRVRRVPRDRRATPARKVPRVRRATPGRKAPKARRAIPARQAPKDRQSVVKGTSVSVRVDLGGRRIITQKNKNQKNKKN